MNIVVRQLGAEAHVDLRGLWVAKDYSRGVWFRAPTRDILVADVEHNESQDWGCL